MMKINYKRRWDAIRDSLEDKDAFLISLPGNTRYLANSEAPPGCPPGSTMNFVIIPKNGKYTVAQIMSVFTKHFRVKELVWVKNAFLLQPKWINISRSEFLPLTEKNFNQYLEGVGIRSK